MTFDLTKAAFGKSAVSNLDTARRIPLDEILDNADNFYSITGIEELAESIKIVGLLSPVNVVKVDGGYKLISGHRRVAAFRLLRNGDAGGNYDRIPAMVISGMDDLTETMALITANSTARELTYAERCKQEDMLRKTLLAMRDAGKDIPKNLGQYIADQIGVSRNEVSRMHSVNTNLAPEHKARLEAGELTAQQAYEMSRKPAQEQQADSTKKKQVAGLDAAQRTALDCFFALRGYELAGYVARYGGALRSVAVNGLKSGLNMAAGSFEHIGWQGWSKNVNFTSYPSSFESFSISYTDLYDEFSRYAIGRLRSEADSSSGAQTTTEWQTGRPKSDGEYVCRMRWNPEAEWLTTRVMYFIDGDWSLSQPRTAVVRIGDSVEIVDWVKLPE